MNKPEEDNAKADAVTKGKDKNERPKRTKMDVAIYICGVLFAVGGLWMGYLGVAGHLKDQKLLGLWVFYGTLISVVTGAFLFFHQRISNIQEAQNAQVAARTKERFPAAVEFIFGSAKRDMNPSFWYAIGGAIYPAHAALFIRVVNNGPPSMMRFPEVQARNSKGDWVNLIKIPYPQEGYGAFYRTFDHDLRDAMQWTAPCFEPQIVNRVIPSHDVVRGWAFFEVPEDLEIEPGTKLRIQIRDVAGDESLQEVVTEESTLLVPMTSSDEKTDLSRHYKYYWSDQKFVNEPAPVPTAAPSETKQKALPTPDRSKPETEEVPKPEAKKPIPSIDAGAGTRDEPFQSPLKWTDYTEDYFYDAIWRWEYRPEMGNTPRNIVGYCPECKNELRPKWVQYRDNGTLRSVIFTCDAHPLKQYTTQGHGIDPYGRIRLSILRMLRNGKWEEVVRHQQRARSGQV